MRTIKDRFKKFGGTFIPDIFEYIREYVERDPTVTISVGCDSIQRRRKTIYAVTIMMYNSDIKNGAHVVFFREACPKIRNTDDRLDREAMLAYEVAEELGENIKSFYSRKDLTLENMRAYKFHTLRCAGEYAHVDGLSEHNVVSNLPISDEEMNAEYKLVDLHLDFNPEPGATGKNKSYPAFKKHTPWLKGVGYRVFVKHSSHAATSAADLLLKC